MNKTVKQIHKTEPDLLVKSKPLSDSEKERVSAMIEKSKEKYSTKGIHAD